MAYTIKQTPIRYNFDPNDHLTPTGIVIHSTATPEATDEGEFNYFNACNRDASAHFFVDYDSISQFIAETIVSWHAGYTANHRFIGIELCEFKDATKFTETWNRGVWLTATLAIKWGIAVDKIFTHHQISDMYHESNHTDPDAYFAAHGKNFNMFKADVVAMIKSLTVPVTPAQYTVASGDSLWSISNKYGLSIGQIRAYNYLTTDVLNVGQVLCLTAPSPVYKLTSGGSQVGACQKQEDAMTKGWELYNAGSTDVVMTTPDGSIYTFDKHQDSNPDEAKALAYKASVKFGTDQTYWADRIRNDQYILWLFQKITQ